MTLPAIGVIGLTFLCIFLVVGIAVLLVMTNDNLRYRLCEVLSSYRDPPSADKTSKNSKHRKKQRKNEHSDDMFTSRVPPPPPIELQGNVESDQHNQYLQSAGGNPYVSHNSRNQPHHLPSTSSSHGYPGQQQSYPLPPHQQQQQKSHMYAQQQHQYPRPHHSSSSGHSSGGGRPSSGYKADSGRWSYGYNGNVGSNGTNSPHDSAIGSTSGAVEKKGILKQPRDTIDGRDSSNRTSDYKKHVQMKEYKVATDIS